MEEGLIKDKGSQEPSPCSVRIPNRSVEIVNASAWIDIELLKDQGKHRG
jgi:hypothetical protein